MCENCEGLVNSREKNKLEYIGTRVVEYREREYYRCTNCNQAFYWLDWAHPYYHHLEPLSVNASEIMGVLEE